LPQGDGRSAFTNRDAFLEKIVMNYDAVMQSLARVLAELELLPQKPEEVFLVFAPYAGIAAQLASSWSREIRTRFSGSSIVVKRGAHAADRPTSCCRQRRLIFADTQANAV